MVQGLVRLTLLAVLLLSGCAVTPPAEKAELFKASQIQHYSGNTIYKWVGGTRKAQRII